MKKILLVGAGGYLGSFMTEKLLKKGFSVVAVDRFFFGETLQDLANDLHLTIIKADIRKLDSKLFKNIDVVINLASLSNDPASDLLPKATKAINYKAAVKVAIQAKKAKVKQYIFASSCSVYGANDKTVTEIAKLAPISEYAKSKVLAEKHLLPLSNKNFAVTILRLATLYGLSKRRMRFDLMINIMTLHAYQKNKIFIMGGGKQWRPLLHIDDCIRAFITIIEEKNREKIQKAIYNVGSNRQVYQVFQVANRFKKHFPDISIEYAPDDPDVRSYNVDFTKFKKNFDFLPQKTIDDAITEIKQALEKDEITDSIKTSTLNYYKYLLEADAVISKVKLRNKLF